MILSIHQPAYLPWLGYFHRIAASDAHIVLDHVQFEKNSFINRNRIYLNGGASWLTVPVSTSGQFGSLTISEIEIDNSRDWRTKHWRTLSQTYRKAPHFSAYAGFFEDTFATTWELLAALCEHISSYLLQQFQIDRPRFRSTDLGPRGAKSELILELCKKVGATSYLSGELGRDYLDEVQFRNEQIDVHYQAYAHPEYRQFGGPFVKNLSAIDMLFHYGPESSRMLCANQPDPIR